MRVSWVDVQLGNFVIGKYDNSLIDVINFLIYYVPWWKFVTSLQVKYSEEEWFNLKYK